MLLILIKPGGCAILISSIAFRNTALFAEEFMYRPKSMKLYLKVPQKTEISGLYYVYNNRTVFPSVKLKNVLTLS